MINIAQYETNDDWQEWPDRNEKRSHMSSYYTPHDLVIL